MHYVLAAVELVVHLKPPPQNSPTDQTGTYGGATLCKAVVSSTTHNKGNTSLSLSPKCLHFYDAIKRGRGDCQSADDVVQCGQRSDIVRLLAVRIFDGK